jgi:hypothetical protein
MSLLPQFRPAKIPGRAADSFDLLASIFVFSVTSVLNPFVRFAPRVRGSLFFSTGSSGETISFVPDSPGIPSQ